MIDGIYHVRFTSSMQDFGEGIAIFCDGSVNGGDHGYLYLGKVSSRGNNLIGKLVVKRWNPSVVSVFGNIQEFELEVSGTQSGDHSFQFAGIVTGQPGLQISIVGRFLSDLA